MIRYTFTIGGVTCTGIISKRRLVKRAMREGGQWMDLAIAHGLM